MYCRTGQRCGCADLPGNRAVSVVSDSSSMRNTSEKIDRIEQLLLDTANSFR